MQYTICTGKETHLGLRLVIKAESFEDAIAKAGLNIDQVEAVFEGVPPSFQESLKEITR